jgi:hypothetical protein
MSEPTRSHPHCEQIHHGNLLNAAVRRDITGLNRLFLERVLDPESAAHPWFRIPAAAVARLTLALPEARERAAGSPVALFEVTLPHPGDVSVWRSDAVADQADPGAEGRGQAEIRRSFGLAALEVVRRLVEGAPLAPRIAFGLEPVAEAQLAALSIAESYRLASWPGLIRPRWPAHTRYWEALTDAAAGDGPDVMRWVYSAGLCLLGQCERQPVTVAHSGRRLPRPAHRRGPSGGNDVPC